MEGWKCMQLINMWCRLKDKRQISAFKIKDYFRVIFLTRVIWQTQLSVTSNAFSRRIWIYVAGNIQKQHVLKERAPWYQTLLSLTWSIIQNVVLYMHYWLISIQNFPSSILSWEALTHLYHASVTFSNCNFFFAQLKLEWFKPPILIIHARLLLPFLPNCLPSGFLHCFAYMKWKCREKKLFPVLSYTAQQWWPPCLVAVGLPADRCRVSSLLMRDDPGFSASSCAISDQNKKEISLRMILARVDFHWGQTSLSSR